MRSILFVPLVIFGCVWVIPAAQAPPVSQSVQTQGKRPIASPIPASLRSALSSISASELKGDLSFLASDTLKGRFTPSPELDAAAEFIASRFRAAGLETLDGAPDYFQVADMIERRAPVPTSSLRIEGPAKNLEVPASSTAIFAASQSVTITAAPLLVFPDRDTAALMRANLRGTAILVGEPDLSKLPRDKAMTIYKNMRSFDKIVQTSGAAVEIVVAAQLDPAPPKLRFSDDPETAVPILRVKDSELESWVAPGAKAATGETATVHIPAEVKRKVTVRNVVGVLKGSDPSLSSTCVMLTAHYDHIGTTETGRTMAMPAKTETDDHIYNGANDDGSGTVSVVAVAEALAKVRPRPKRSMIFMTFFGEERGEFGSKYYGRHPLFPVSKTVADLNLEQVGRTDSTAGPQVNTASLTGYDYSDVVKYLEKAGHLTGIKVYKDPEASDAYFTRSDNDALAEQGVPAHSLTVAFDYPDYHGLGDTWQKVDYENMARVDRMIALALLNMANAVKAPAWNSAVQQTAPFIEAQKKSAQQ